MARDLHSPPARHGHGHAAPHALPPPRHRRTLSSTLVDESVAAAAALVHKWHPDQNDDSPEEATRSCSLFLHRHAEDEQEAQRFLRAAADLHRAMLFFASDVTNATTDSQSGHGLVQAQALLQAAMRRLDLELKILLDQSDHPPLAVTTSSIRAVAQAMMAAGYGKECVATFRSHRRTALATKLQRLLGGGGFSLPVPAGPGGTGTTAFNLNKLSWEQIDSTVVPSWLAAAAVAFNSLFTAEKDLCDTVFAAGEDGAAPAPAAVGDAVFTAIANDQATGLLAVAEAVVARAKRAPERLFRVLDVHDALTEALPALLSVFGDSSEVATRAAVAIDKAGDAVRATLSSFEAAIRKEPSKATAAGGAVHPLTRYVMNYLVFLADYQEGLALIYDDDDDDYEQALAGSPSPSPSMSSSRSSSSMSMSSSPIPIPIPSSSIHHRLVSVLLGKLEAKAGCYREVALSYLFLANNTQYVGNKVAGSSSLQAILGEGWAEEQSAKARAHVDVYVRAAWGKVMAAVSSGSAAAPAPAAVEQAVVEAVTMQEQWAAADEEMGEALRVAATVAVVPKYRMFYRRHGAALRLTPGDVTTMIAALFGGSSGSSSGIPSITTTRTTSSGQRCTTHTDHDRHRHQQDPNPRRPPQQLST